MRRLREPGVKLRRRKAPAPLSYWEAKAFEVYAFARASVEDGKIHPRTLARNGGTARTYADYHAGRYALDVLGRTYTSEDATRFDRIYRSLGSA